MTESSFSSPVYRTQENAEFVLESLRDTIKKHQFASVADLHILSSISKITFADDMRGWTDLQNASASPTEDGFVLLLPEPRPITI